MPEYQLEVRFAGQAREHIMRLIYACARRFNIKGLDKDYIPCLVLYGPVRTADEEGFICRVSEAAAGFSMVTYRIKCFDSFDGGRKWLLSPSLRGVYLDIEPSDSLRKLRAELAGRLEGVGEAGEPVDLSKFWAHVELGELDDRFGGVVSFLKANMERDMSQRLLRLTVVRNGEVFCEYDLRQGRMVNIVRQRQTRTFGKALDRIRHSSEDAIQPIWETAHKLAGRRRTGRQLTLVEDNPAIRVPKVFLIGKIGGWGAARGRKSRQLTLLEDEPAYRVPRVFALSEPAPKRRAGREGKGVQITLSDGKPLAKKGVFSPLMGIHRRLRRRLAAV